MNQNSDELNYMFEDSGPVEPPTAKEYFDFFIETKRFEGEPYEDILRLVRKESGLSIHEAATQMGVTPGKLIDWEEGSIRPTWVTVRKLALALDLVEERPESDG